MSKVIEELNKELENIKDQRESYLAEYGEKVRKLGEEETALITNKKVLEDEIKGLKNDKDSEANRVLGEARSIREEAKAVLADAKSEMAIVQHAKEEVDAQAVADGEKVKALSDNAQKRFDNSRKIEADAIKFMKGNKIKGDELERLRGDLRDKISKANKIIAKNNKKQEAMGEKIIKLDKEIKKFDAESKAIKNLKADLAQKIQYNRDLADSNEVKEVSLKSDIEKYQEIANIAKKEQDDYIVILKAQKEANKTRSLELDFGFEKLDNESKSNQREKKRLKEMKKEILTKE